MGESPDIQEVDQPDVDVQLLLEIQKRFKRDVNLSEYELCKQGKLPKFFVGQEVIEAGINNTFVVANMFYYYPWENWVYSDGKTNMLISEVALRLVDSK